MAEGLCRGRRETAPKYSKDDWHRGHDSTALWPHGGMGYIISRGMAKEITASKFLECVERYEPCSHADTIVGNCFFHFGYGLTHFPLLEHQKGGTGQLNLQSADSSLSSHGTWRPKRCRGDPWLSLAGIVQRPHAPCMRETPVCLEVLHSGAAGQAPRET